MLHGFEPMVRDALVQFLERHSHDRGTERKVAVFDADGTLWRGDVGESFFARQIERQSMPAAPKQDPSKKYFDAVQAGNAAEAYGWLAQWNAGVSEERLGRWADEFFRDVYSKQIFAPMLELSHALLNAGFELWVVSASVRWVVAAGVRGFGIQADHVIGTAVSVENGVLTDRIDIVPYRAVKAKLIESVIGAKPLLAAGNTYWDKEMLSTATEIALAVHSEEKTEPNFDSEQRLKRLAETNGWLVQRF